MNSFLIIKFEYKYSYLYSTFISKSYQLKSIRNDIQKDQLKSNKFVLEIEHDLSSIVISNVAEYHSKKNWIENIELEYLLCLKW